MLLAGLWLAPGAPATAHPIPFSYLDLRIADDGIEASLVAHMIDLAHELGIEQPERLLLPDMARRQAEAISEILGPRLRIAAGGEVLAPLWSEPEVIRDRQSLRLHFRYALDGVPGRLDVSAELFPYDTNHQTFSTSTKTVRCAPRPSSTSAIPLRSTSAAPGRAPAPSSASSCRRACTTS